MAETLLLDTKLDRVIEKEGEEAQRKGHHDKSGYQVGEKVPLFEVVFEADVRQ